MYSTDSIMKTLSGVWLDLRVAAAFLTRLPLGPRGEDWGEDGKRPLAEAARVFPLVGAAIGAVSGLTLYLAFELGLHPLACALLALLVGVLLTGALHEDGLADVADGFGGGKSAADKLKIMRDSRIGVYGVLAVVFSIGLRASALSGMFTPGTAAMSLVCAGALSRAVLPVLMALMTPARDDGLGAGAGRPGNECVISAVVLGVALAFLFPFPGAVVVALVVAALAAAALAWLAASQVGGQTGDVLGAAQQSVEVAVLLTLAAAVE